MRQHGYTTPALTIRVLINKVVYSVLHIMYTVPSIMQHMCSYSTQPVLSLYMTTRTLPWPNDTHISHSFVCTPKDAHSPSIMYYTGSLSRTSSVSHTYYDTPIPSSSVKEICDTYTQLLRVPITTLL